MSQTEDQYAAECATWQARAEQAEALVERLQRGIKRVADDCQEVACLTDISDGERRTWKSIAASLRALLADPVGARLTEEQRALEALYQAALKDYKVTNMRGQVLCEYCGDENYLWPNHKPTCVVGPEVAAVERARAQGERG